MTKIVGVNEWSDVILFENGDVLTGGIKGKVNEQSIALVNRTNWLKEKVEDASSGISESEEEKLLWLSTNLADPLLSSKYPKVGQVLAVSETKSNLSGKETLTYKLVDLPAEGAKGETGPAGPQGIPGEKGDTGERGPMGLISGLRQLGNWQETQNYFPNDMVFYVVDGSDVLGTWVATKESGPDTIIEIPRTVSSKWTLLSRDGMQGAQGIQGEDGGGSSGIREYGFISIRRKLNVGTPNWSPDVDYIEKITRMPAEEGYSWIIIERTYHKLGHNSYLTFDSVIWDMPIINGISFVGELNPTKYPSTQYTNHRGSYYGGFNGMDWNEYPPDQYSATTITAPIEYASVYGFKEGAMIKFQVYTMKPSMWNGPPEILFKNVNKYSFTFDFTVLVKDSDYGW